MKNIKTLLVAIAAAAALPLSAANYVFIAGNDTTETKLCIAAAEDNLKRYKKTARALSMKKSIHRTLAEKLDCNDQSVLAFAQEYDAHSTAGFISRYSKEQVIIKREVSEVAKASIDDGKTIYVTVN